MMEAQKLIAGLLLVFVAGGLVTLAMDRSSPTGLAVSELPASQGNELFCYRSHFCQSGIECMYVHQRLPFCTQPAAIDRYTAQSFGDPCYIEVDGHVECPLVRQ